MNQLSSVPHELFRPQQSVTPAGGPPNNLNPLLQEEEPEFLECWRAIMLRKWSILVFTVLVGVAAAFVVSQLTPVYRSSAVMLIETNRAKVTRIEEVYTDVQGAGALQTQAGVLNSRIIAERVIDRLKLTRHPEFDPRQAKLSISEQWLTDNLPSVAAAVGASPERLTWDEAAARESVIRAFGRALSVEPVRLSQLIKLSFEAKDRDLAAAVANAVAAAYIEQEMETRTTVTKDAGQWINQRMVELKAKLDTSEKALQAYREREGLIDSKSVAAGSSGKQMDELTNKLVEARVRRSEIEESYNQVKAGAASNYGSVPAVVRSPGVLKAREVESEAEKKLAEMAQRYGPKHPKYVAADSDLTAARENTKKQVQTIVDSVVKEYTAAKATERTIEEALAQSKGAIQTLNRKEIQLGVLERDAATNRQLFETFLSRYKETAATSDSRQPSARLVDIAVPGNIPVRPHKTRTVAMAAGLALLLGIIVALLLKRLDNTVKTRDDVEHKLHQPFLAALPVLQGKWKTNAARAVLESPHDVYAECIRTASTGILLSALDTPNKIVAITSSVPGEGKSTFSMNLAFSQAKSQRVLLIEGDMRRPCFAKAFRKGPEQKGLSELVSGQGTLDECLLQIEGTELHAIVAGAIPPNPLELLLSQRYKDVLAQLHMQYDLIIIDSPPVQLVSDALVIGNRVTGLIYIVKADETPAPLAQTGLKRIAAAGISIIGVVLNQQDFKKAERYYGEYSGYKKYGYGKPYGSPEVKRIA